MIKKILISLLIISFLFAGCDSNNKSTQKNTHILIVTSQEGGSVSLVNKELKTAATGEEFEHGEVIILTPHAEEGWYFSHWEGDLTGAENPAEITVEDDMNISAVFQESSSLSGTITVEYNTYGTSLDKFSQLNSTEPLPIPTNSIKRDIKEDTLVIGFQANLSPPQKNKIVKSLGGKIIREIKALNAALIRVDKDLNQNVQAQSLPGVRFSEPDYVARITGDYVRTPNDEYYPQQWNLELIDIPYSWTLDTGSSDIRIAVLDTGINASHPDLRNRIDTVHGYNFSDDNYNTDDNHGHGTHVAGIISSATNNYRGVAGITWEGEILPVKVLDREGNGSYSAIANGILYAAGLLENPRNPEPVDIINLSLGAYQESTLLHEAIKRARKAGVLVIASSGNDGEETVMYPAAYPEVIAVGAANSAGEKSSYSNYGPELDIIAPGGSSVSGIISTYLNSDYAVMAGTSMATPHVAGVAGLMLARGIYPDNIQKILQTTAIHPGEDTFSPEYGHGLINSNWALNEIETINIMIGTRQSNSIKDVASTTIPLKGGSYQIDELPTGEYQIYAWIDSNKDGKITPGDYITESKSFNFASGNNYKKDLTIRID